MKDIQAEVFDKILEQLLKLINWLLHMYFLFKVNEGLIYNDK